MGIPSVSVVIPTRNRSGLLKTTLRSVLWQRDVDLEVIVVDEASSDDTAGVVASFKDPHVVLVRHERPLGPSGARNSGSARARGEWLAFVDDDDVWAPDKIARQVAAADATDRVWAYGGVVNIGASMEVVSGVQSPSPEVVMAALPGYNPIPGGTSNAIVKRSAFAAVGRFDERLPPCEDWDLWARLASIGPPAADNGRPLVGYRLHAGNSSLDAARIVSAAHLLEQLHKTTVDWGRLHRWLAESYLRRECHARAIGEFDKAAFNGQARGVASDLADIARRRVRRLGHPMSEARGRQSGDPDALEWLRALSVPRPATRN